MNHASLPSEADTSLNPSVSTLLHPSLTSVAEDASTLAAQHQDPQLTPNHQQGQVSIDEDSLHGLQCAVEELDYSRQSHQTQHQHHHHQQPHLQSLVKRPDQHVDIRTILDPPDLAAWRERLFNVDEMIVLSEEQCVVITLLRMKWVVDMFQIPNIFPTH